MNNENQSTTAISTEETMDFYQKAVRQQDFLISISAELLLALRFQEIHYCMSHIKIIAIILSGLEPMCDDQKVKSLPVSYPQMHHNISWTMDRIEERINAGQYEEAKDLTEFQLIPFLKDWREDTYFWLLIYPDKEKMAKYYESEFVKNHKNTYQNRGEKYLVSIFIPVYNKLEYTKKCLESLYRHTDLEKYPCELILLNDGSTDGTEDYFSQLGVRKVITLKENVKAMIFSLMYRVCEGKYAAFVNNDTILTEHWLDNLLACIRSDPMIISAAPSTPNTSNRQGMVEEFTPENAEEKAEKHNQSSPYLWEERCRLMPVIALYDVDKVDTIGFADRYFYTMEFWDDDFSLRARRAGYKQILCKDTWCYHFGSVSGKEDQIKNRTLQNGRSLFIQKYGIDPWGNNFCYDPYLMSHLETTFPDLPADIPILGIDPGFGADILQLKNLLRRLGKKMSFSFLITDHGLEADMRSLSSTISLSPSVFELHKYIPEGSYRYICIGKDLSAYPAFMELLTECTAHLEEGGILVFYAGNPYSLRVKNELAGERLLNGKYSVTFINVIQLTAILNQLGLQIQLRGILGTNLPPVLKQNLSEHLDRYFVLCTKAKQ
ncbi:glycosyltransferase family 2 protein [Clostridium sp. Marseille-P2415]|uniref:glycosyltransferase family 2 protein n=1 Tax=Clostridium sp. Marseille-P2415 TaxID=1805471 RepID=UPI0009884129|nr:glycosyltransferase [Clostridium sp. Marseille-P2415]